MRAIHISVFFTAAHFNQRTDQGFFQGRRVIDGVGAVGVMQQTVWRAFSQALLDQAAVGSQLVNVGIIRS